MATTTTELQKFNIHRLTQAQYQALVTSGGINQNELYLVTDATFSVEKTTSTVNNNKFTVVDAISTDESGLVTGINVKTVTVPIKSYAGSNIFASGPDKYTEVSLSGTGLEISDPDDYVVMIQPTSELGKVGEIMVTKAASSFKVYHTGSSTGSFDYIIHLK